MTIETNFRDLATAALKLSGDMLAALSPETQDSINGALHGGARLTLEFGPLPAFESFALVLVEREGRRHIVGSVSVNTGPLQ